MFYKKIIKFLKTIDYFSIYVYTDVNLKMEVIQMKEKENSETGLYIKIDEGLKKQFNLKCIKNGTNMSTVVKDYINKYIDVKNS